MLRVMAATLFSPDRVKILHALCVEQRLPHAQAAAELNARCGTAFTALQVERSARQRWPEVRAGASRVVAAVAAGARVEARPERRAAAGLPPIPVGEGHVAGVMQQFGATSEKLLQQADKFVDGAQDVRTLSGAASVLRAALAVFSAAHELERGAARERAPERVAYNLNFANVPMPLADGSGYVGGWPPGVGADAAELAGAAAALELATRELGATAAPARGAGASADEAEAGEAGAAGEGDDEA